MVFGCLPQPHDDFGILIVSTQGIAATEEIDDQQQRALAVTLHHSVRGDDGLTRFIDLLTGSGGSLNIFLDIGCPVFLGMGLRFLFRGTAGSHASSRR